jgi:hypothetical protein
MRFSFEAVASTYLVAISFIPADLCAQCVLPDLHGESRSQSSCSASYGMFDAASESDYSSRYCMSGGSPGNSALWGDLGQSELDSTEERAVNPNRFALFGVSGGIAYFEDRYLWSEGGDGSVVHGAWYAGVNLDRVKVQFNLSSEVDFRNDQGSLLVTDDVNDFTLDKWSLTLSYAIVTMHSRPGGFYAGLGVTHLSINQNLQDYPPYRTIGSSAYQTGVDASVRYYSRSTTAYGLNLNLALISSFSIHQQLSGFWGLQGDANLYSKEVDGLEKQYSPFNVFFGFTIGLIFDVH